MEVDDEAENCATNRTKSLLRLEKQTKIAHNPGKVDVKIAVEPLKAAIDWESRC